MPNQIFGIVLYKICNTILKNWNISDMMGMYTPKQPAMEHGKLSTCGRCIDVPGLCEQCGYFFVAEYTLLFRGNPKIIFEMLHTYLKYI